VGLYKTSYDHHKITTTNGEYFEATDCFHSTRNKSQTFWPVFLIKLLRLFLGYRVGINKTSHDHHKNTTTMENTLKQQIVSSLLAASLRSFGWLFINVLTIIFKLQGGYL